MAGGRRWTPEEEELLRECWGTMTMAGMCKKLGRSRNAIVVRVNRLGLPPYLESGEYITMRQLSLALGFGWSSDKYFQKSWVEKRGFPVHNKRRGKAVVRVVYLDRRIPPQYCARCGSTFYERAENRFCGPCRQARKRQAQRKWCREMARR